MPNNSPSTAIAVNLGVPITGSLGTAADWDYFKVAVGSSGVLKVDFSAPTSSPNFYFYVAVYDGSQKLLASDFVGASTSFSLGVPIAGNYYVAVTSASLYSAAQYGVTVSMAAGSASGFESESNDSLLTANAIVQTIKGQLANSQDVDCFRVAATTTGVLVVDFAAPMASASTTFTVGIYDAAGKLLQSHDTGNTLTLSAAVPAPGNYYVKVTQANSYDGGNYSLTVHDDSFPALAAKALAGVGSVPLTLSASHDWYSVNLTAGASYEFALAGSSSGGGTLADPSLTLCYSNGTSLETCDNLAYYAQGQLTSTNDPQIAFTAPKTGTYYLMIGGNGGTGTFTLTEKIDAVSTLALDLLELQTYPDHRWNSGSALGTPVQLSYSFLSSTADNVTGFVAMNLAQQAIVKSVLAQYSAIANIGFTYTSDPTAAQIRFGTSSQSGSAGITYSDVGALKQADVFLDNSSGMPSLSDGFYSLQALIHEIGHALGLKHPGNYDSTGATVSGPFLPLAWENGKFSVMSYVDNPDAGVYSDTPALLDIAAVQYLYGANISGNGQTHTFSFSNSSPFVTSLLSSGTSDTIDLSNQLSASTVFLTPGSLSSIGVGANGTAARDNVAIPFSESVANVITGPGNDLIVGNALDNKFFGFSVGDTIDGGGGNNTLVLASSSTGLNSATDSQLVNVQTVDARAAAGVTIDLHNQSERINIAVGPGNDTIVGGPGRDVLVYAGNRADYLVANTSPGNGFAGTVSAAAGSDTVSNVERFQFADKKLAFDMSGSAGNTAKIIGAAFGLGYLSNAPDYDAIKGQGIAIFDSGTTMQQLSAVVVHLDMFVQMEGTSSNSDFVNFVFKNVVGRQATTDEVTSLVHQYFDAGMTQADVLAMAANLDVNVQHVGLVGLAGKGLEYV